jgi:hypothetical protein
MVHGEELYATVYCATVNCRRHATAAQHVHDSDAISDSRKRPMEVSSTLREGLRCVYTPGIIYVSDRSADSICDTALLFLVMKSEYMPSHSLGMDSTSVVRCVACLYIAVGAPVGGDCYNV